jgi:hypothetical protein
MQRANEKAQRRKVMELLTKVALGAKNLALDTAVAVRDEVTAGVQRLPWWIVTGGAVLIGQWLQCL